MRDPSKCIHCDGEYRASTANARLCMGCANRCFNVGFDEDGKPLHVLVKDGKTPRYDDDNWVKANALRPDGTKAICIRPSEREHPHAKNN